MFPQAQKERVREGEEFAGKEAFVTGKYREEMEKMKQLAEEDRLEELEEKRNDVTKRNDLSALHRNLYSGNMGKCMELVECSPVTMAPPRSSRTFHGGRLSAISPTPPLLLLGTATTADPGKETEAEKKDTKKVGRAEAVQER